LHHDYPAKHQQRAITPRPNSANNPSPITIGISEQDIQLALYDMDTFLDVSYSELRKLLDTIQKHRFIQLSQPISCGDIMLRNVTSVEYGTEVEDAWKIMHSQNLKALPVIDKSRRVIGIVTWHDFLKFITVDDTKNFSNALLKFIRRTPNISSNKPEAVGRIMTTKISVLPETAPIAELIPLMSNQGHRQVPIVNAENRLVGMVHQANLISALYANFNPLQHKTTI
jgi:CBS domain-containing membrane protein